jgi:site-specific DNA-methyltransferase (adenine-specific)
MFSIYAKSCYGLNDIPDNSVDAVVTDPPYGIDLEDWDKLPDTQIWKDCFRVLKPGAFLFCFSAIKFQHIFTTNLLNAGFEFKDVLLWTYLNGRVPPIDLDKKIDNHLGIEREVVGQYNYMQGSPNSKKKDTYKSTSSKTKASTNSEQWVGFGSGLKTAYEPIIMVQKPLEGTLAQNVLKHGVGALNIDSTRIPYETNEDKVGHNPHHLGRVMSNIIQTESFGNYEKYFNINHQKDIIADDYENTYFFGKVRDGKKTGNFHPTKKPVSLMECLNKLVTIEGQTILDPFMGSGSTGVAALHLKRNFIGYEQHKDFFQICEKRLNDQE